MEKRLGVIAVLIENREHIDTINNIFSTYSELILGRQGIPLRDKGIQIISLIIEGTTDTISALTGKLGRLDGVKVKSVLTSYKENNHETNGS